MVRLFRKSGLKRTTTFKFKTSLQLKNLPLEEYAHVIHAFHKGLTELDYCLKESLMENYISFFTFERISQELKLVKFKGCEIPNVPSIKTLFYSKAVDLKTSELEIITRIKQIEEETPLQEVLQGPPQIESVPSPFAPQPQGLSISPTAPPTSPPPTPKITFSKTVTEPTSPLGFSKPRREHDRATGIAILRKQMVSELKKIRSAFPDDY